VTPLSSAIGNGGPQATCWPAESIATLTHALKRDGLRPLPDHVLAPLLHALTCIPRTAETRLA